MLRKPIVLVMLVLISLMLAACGNKPASTPAPSGGGGAAPAPPLKVGLLAPQTGTAAAAGKDMINGWKLYWQLNGDTVAGRKIETVYYDTASDANTALTKARQAVEQDKVKMLFGPYLANEGLAVAPFTIQNKVPLILPTVSADDLTQRKASPYVLRVGGWSSSLTTHPAGEWAYDQGYRKVMTICNAYAFGYEMAGGFSHTFTEKGGQITKQLWAPLGTTDYSPYISQIIQAKPDAVFVEMVGADAVKFLEQWLSLGAKGKIPLIGNETLTDQSNIRTVAPEATLDITTFGHYAEGREDPVTQNFIKEYGKAYTVYPSYMATAFYTAAQWIAMAAKNAGTADDTEKLLAAVKAVKLDNSPLGPMEMDTYGNPIENVYIRKTVQAPDQTLGKVWNVVTYTYPKVSQFWKWTPEEFMKNPVYSDSYQGIKK